MSGSAARCSSGSPSRRDDAGVVAGGDEVGVELLAVRPELAELQPVVADDARVGRAAGEVLVGEVVDDAVEVALEVEGVERDVEPVGDAAGVAGVDGASSSPSCGRRRRVGLVGVRAGAHEQADDVVALLLEQHRRRELSTPPLIASTTRPGMRLLNEGSVGQVS